MRSSRQSFFPRLVLGLLAVFFVLSLSAAPRPAHAQLSTITNVIIDIPRQIYDAAVAVQQKLDTVLKTTTAVAFKNALNLFTTQLVNQIQTQLSTAAPGQKPLFLTNPKTFFQNVSAAAASQYIDDFSRGLTGQTGPGTSLSNTRANFLISSFLRAQVGQVGGNMCTDLCHQNNSVLDGRIADVSKYPVPSVYSEAFVNGLTSDSFNNDHEWKVFRLEYDMNGPNGSQAQVNKNAATMPGDVCPDVVPLGQVGGGFGLGLGQAFPGLTPTNCLNAQNQVQLAERQAAQSETNSCLQDCQAGVNGIGLTGNANTFGSSVLGAIQSGNPAQAPAALANALSGSTSDIGRTLGAAAMLTAVVQNRVLGEQTNLNPNILPKTTNVSGEVISPSTISSQLLGIPFTGSGSNNNATFTGVGVADILNGIASFINSPVGKALATYFNTKCGLNPDLCRGPSNPKSSIGQLVFGSGGPTGVAGAQLLYATQGQAQIISGNPGNNQISVTDQLATNGIIDSSFRTAIDSELTVQQAIDQHLLDPNKTIGFDKNGVQPTDGYPFRSLQYLRKYRVIPVGWELAAEYSQQFDHRDLSLGYLISQFNMCGQDHLINTCSLNTAVQCDPNKGNADCTVGGKNYGACQATFPTPSHDVCLSGPDAGKTCTFATNGSGANSCTPDNGQAVQCGASSYCGLVDPNWVLKAPQTYCRRQGAGEEIVTKQFVCDQNNINKWTGQPISAQEADANASSPTNSTLQIDNDPPNCDPSVTNHDLGRWVITRNTDTCADVQSCIAENPDGTCIAYGYCVQEKSTIKFNGTQCDAQNSSCTAYTDPSGTSVAYLANTLDFRTCSASNAGCQQYCAATNPDGSANYDPSTKTCPNPQSTINFNAKVQRCDQTAAGCNEYLQTTNGSNEFANSGFESASQAADSGIPATFDGWTPVGSVTAKPVTADDASITANNKIAVSLSGLADTDGLSQIVHTGHSLYERDFTFSVRAKATGLAAGSTCPMGLTVDSLFDNTGLPTASIVGTPTVTPDWTTVSVTLFEPMTPPVPITNFDVRATLALGGCANDGLVIDSAQFEENAGPTQYKDYGSINAVYLNGTRQQCTAADVGCDAYTPKDGSAVVDGILLNSNLCSADKVGCDTYQLQPITSLPPRSGGPVNIVAPKGQQCTAADVGCEEYTNLDTVAQGGEGKEYYKDVKQCVKPSDGLVVPDTYYTWVGDAQKGFVLQAYNFVKSNINDQPCTHLSIGSTTADPSCVDTVQNLNDASCSAAEMATNPDCTQYYDSLLRTYYLLKSRTVSVTPDCHPYRNTIDQQSGANNVYYLATSENVSCGAAAAGCRAYTGNASGTTRQLFADNFENTAAVNWTGGLVTTASTSLNGHSLDISIPAGQNSGFSAVNQSILQGQFISGKSYLVAFDYAATAAIGGGTPAPIVSAAIGKVGSANGLLQFTPTLTFPGTATGAWNSNITPPGPEWHHVTLGPLAISTTVDASNQLALTVSGSNIFIDNVVVTEVTDNLYLISNTVPQCQPSEVGCAAYTDRHGHPVYATSFNRLCSQPVVGCEALIDTQNSSTAFAQTVPPDGQCQNGICQGGLNDGLACTTSVQCQGQTTPADNVVTLVNSPSDYCAATNVGCQAVGQPIYSADHSLTGYTTVYLKNTPDQYSALLCLNNALACQSYTTTDGTAAFFKDPTGQECDYRTDSASGSGSWFITGTTIPCPTVTPPLAGRPVGASCSPACAGGARQGKACTTDGDCPASKCVGNVQSAGQVKGPNGSPVIGQCTTNADCLDSNTCLYQVGSCPAEQSGCTEYRDPSDPASCQINCPFSTTVGGQSEYVDPSCSPTTCNAVSANAGQACQTDADCFGTTNSGAACVNASNQPATGLPGCRSYFYIKQTLQSSTSQCNGVINPAIGCNPFFDTTNPVLNFRGK